VFKNLYIPLEIPAPQSRFLKPFSKVKIGTRIAYLFGQTDKNRRGFKKGEVQWLK
jgi:hypothetical protein